MNNRAPDELKLYAVVRADGTTVEIVTDEHSATRAIAEDLSKRLGTDRTPSPDAAFLTRTPGDYKVELLHSRKLKRGERVRLPTEHKAEQQEVREENGLDPKINEIVEAIANLFDELKVSQSEAAAAMSIVFAYMVETQPANRANVVRTCRRTADFIEAYRPKGE